MEEGLSTVEIEEVLIRDGRGMGYRWKRWKRDGVRLWRDGVEKSRVDIEGMGRSTVQELRKCVTF
jgi:hypothetical protein